MHQSRGFRAWSFVRFALGVLIVGCLSSPVAAHPADEINERDAVHVRPDGIGIEMTVSAGALTLRDIWADADRNGDGILDGQETAAFGAFLGRGIRVSADGNPLSLAYTANSLEMQPTLRDFTLQGADATGATVRARFDVPFDASSTKHEITLSIQHYNHRANGRPVELIPDAAAPLGIIVQGGTDVDLRLTTSVGGPVPLAAPPPPQRNPNHASVTTLQRFVRLPAGGSLTLAGLGIAILLGALHALTPGHGKTLVAAYLIGRQGRPRDAVALGGILTVTHTGSVIAVGLVLLIGTHTVTPDRFLPAIEAIGSLCIIVLGVALLPRRVALATIRGRGRPRTSVALAGEHTHEGKTAHTHGWFGTAAHTHRQVSTGTGTENLRSVLLLGIGGGIVPCPDALAILLIAVAAGHVVTGLIILLGFSVGLAAVLTGLGLLLTLIPVPTRSPGRFAHTARMSQWLPVASAIMIVLIGLNGLWRATTLRR